MLSRNRIRFYGQFLFFNKSPFITAVIPLAPHTYKPLVGFAGRHANGNLPSQERAFMLSEQALQEFKRIWKEERGEEISDELAMEEATQLLTLFDAIYKPIKKLWLDDGKNRQSSE